MGLYVCWSRSRTMPSRIWIPDSRHRRCRPPWRIGKGTMPWGCPLLGVYPHWSADTFGDRCGRRLHRHGRRLHRRGRRLHRRGRRLHRRGRRLHRCGRRLHRRQPKAGQETTVPQMVVASQGTGTQHAQKKAAHVAEGERPLRIATTKTRT